MGNPEEGALQMVDLEAHPVENEEEIETIHIANEPEHSQRCLTMDTSFDEMAAQHKVKGYTVTLEKVSYSIDVIDNAKSSFLRKKYKSKPLVKSVTATFGAGKMHAIMGQSGAGKSTLLDVIAGRKTKGKTAGDILFNGNERPKNFKTIAGYVEQSDVVVQTLTVYECLFFSCELRLLKNKFNRQMKDERIEFIINQLGLQKCRNTVVGSSLVRGISGGELKRLSIGLELVVLPPILFLDEPSSGLDSATTMDVVNVLRKLAANGHTVICTIHQPSAESFSLFDQLLLLTQGYVCFNGNAKAGAPYLKSLGFSPLNPEFGFNPAEFLLSVTGGGTGSGIPTVSGPKDFDFEDAWKTHCLNTDGKVSLDDKVAHDDEGKIKLTEDKESGFVNPFWFVCWTLMRRNFVGVKRDQDFLRMRIVKNIAVSLIIISVYWDVFNTGVVPNQNALALTFMIITLWGMNGIGYVTSAISGRDVFYRERQAGAYSVLPYFISQIILEWPFAICTTCFFSTSVYFGCGFEADVGLFFFFWLTVFLVNEVACAFAHFISAICSTIEVAIAVAPMLMILQFLFCGFLITQSSLPPYWRYTVRYVSLFTYSLAAIAQNTFLGTPNEKILYQYELLEIGKWENLAVLTALIIMWRVFGYLSLRFVRHYER